MTIKALYPNVRPSLNLDFAKTKVLDPRITFTRASTATFVGADGLIQTAASGAARFDHNPATGESLGLLVEVARTNRVLYSDMTVTSTSLTRTTETNLTGVFLQSPLFTNPTGDVDLYVAVGGTVNTNDIVSVFVRQKTSLGGNPCIGFRAETSGSQAYFNLDTLALTITGAQWSNLKYQSLGNGWYRFYATYLGNITSGMRIYITASNAFFGPAAGTAFYITGVQSEAGAFPTSYIPTTSATVTRAADVATLSNTNSSIFPTSAFTVVNSPFGTAGGGSTVKLVGPTIKRTAIYNGDLTQTQINTLAGVNDEFWRWRVTGLSFALTGFTTDGSVTVDWGDGVVETLTTAAHTFTDSNAYHTIGFRLNSGTYFKPNVFASSVYRNLVTATGPAPASMKVDANTGFASCLNLRAFDATVDTSVTTSFLQAWTFCSNLTSFPLINTAAGTNFNSAWNICPSLTSFPLINTAAGTNFQSTWGGCSNLTSFPLINTAAGTNFQNTWSGCTGLTSFPLINTAAGTNFNSTWSGCTGLTSFPLINTAAGTTFQNTWNVCTNLSSFPANMFNTTGTLAASAFSNAFSACALTATSIENILTSLVTNGQSNITLTLSGGTNAGASTWTTAANTAYATLISRGWTITRNA